MATRRRRRRVRKHKPLPPTDDRLVRRQVEHLDSMDCPNNNCCFDLPVKPGDVVPYQPRFPMMQLACAANNGGRSERLLFVDRVYGVLHWSDRDQDCPPSWMDPEIFVRMVLADPRAREIYAAYAKTRAAVKKRQLVQLVQEVFEREYLVYVLSQFESAAELLADWVVGHYATQDKDFPKPGTRAVSRRQVDR